VSLISARGGSQWSSEGDVRLVHHVASAEVTSTALAIKLGVEVRVERGGKERTGVGSGTRIDWMCSEVVIVHNTSGNRSDFEVHVSIARPA
jgi:hypothetical protein